MAFDHKLFQTVLIYHPMFIQKSIAFVCFTFSIFYVGFSDPVKSRNYDSSSQSNNPPRIWLVYDPKINKEILDALPIGGFYLSGISNLNIVAEKKYAIALQ